MNISQAREVVPKRSLGGYGIFGTSSFSIGMYTVVQELFCAQGQHKYIFTLAYHAMLSVSWM